MNSAEIDPAARTITRLIHKVHDGDRAAAESLWPLVLNALRQTARRQVGPRERATGYDVTDLVNDTYVKLYQGGEAPDCASREQFRALCARVMRSVLVDRARAAAASKRPSSRGQVPFDEELVSFEERSGDLVALDECLERLGRADAELRSLVELRFFGGLTLREIAEATGLAPRTVDRRLQFAKAWLHKELA